CERRSSGRSAAAAMKQLARRVYRWIGRPSWVETAYRKLLGKDKYVPDQWVRSIAAWVGGLEGKKVLEVGCDHRGSFSRQISQVGHAIEVVGVNPVLSARVEIAPGCRIEPGDARSRGYPD